MACSVIHVYLKGVWRCLQIDVGDLNTPLLFCRAGGVGVKRLRGRKKGETMNLSRIKDVIVIHGVANSGKTGVLRQLCADFEKLVGAGNYYQEYSAKGKKDVVARVLLPDNRVLGIGTAGDNADTVLENFVSFSDLASVPSNFVNAGCDIVVIPLRMLSISRRFVQRYQKNRSLAEIEFDEILSQYGRKWNLLSPKGKTQIQLKHIDESQPGYMSLRKNEARTALADIHSLIGF